MKKILTLAFILATTLLFGQSKNDKKIYLDSLGHVTTEGNHKYYRIIKSENILQLMLPNNEYTDYYLDGQIKTEVVFNHEGGSRKNGTEKEYYASGKLKSQTNLNNAHQQFGMFYSLYENGNKEIEGEFVKIKTDVVKEHIVLKILSYWDENGNQKVIDGNGLMIEKGKKIDESSRGKVLNGLKTGIWTGFNSTHKIQFADQYESGIFIAGVSKDINNNEHTYLELDKLPGFRDEGMTGFTKFVQKNYVMPELEDTVKGRVFIEFSVDADSKVSDVKIMRGLHKKVDREAVRLIHYSSGLWTPGEYRGVKTKVRFTLPIVIDVEVNKYGLN